MPRTDISFGTGKLHVRVAEDLWLIRGLGNHQLRIPMEIESCSLQENALVLLRGALWLDLQGPAYIAPWETEEPVALRSFASPANLAARISDAQLALIEQARGGGDLCWRVDISAAVSPSAGAWPTGGAQVSLRIPRSTWLRQLESLGAAAAVTVVVPVPLTAGDRQQMGQRIRQAQAAIDDGRFADAVATARLALETARTRESLVSESALRGKQAKSRTQHERWSAMHHAIWELTNLAHHEGDSAERSWSRSDAVAIVAATAALIARQD